MEGPGWYPVNLVLETPVSRLQTQKVLCPYSRQTIHLPLSYLSKVGVTRDPGKSQRRPKTPRRVRFGIGVLRVSDQSLRSCEDFYLGHQGPYYK